MAERKTRSEALRLLDGGMSMEQPWTREELKMRAKDALRKNYWACVIVALILTVVTALGAGNSGREAVSETRVTYYEDTHGELGYGADLLERGRELLDTLGTSPVGIIFGLIGAGLIVVFVVFILAFGIFVGNVLEVGGNKFFIENMYSAPRVGRILYGFRSGNYWNIVKTMFCRDLFVFLWMFLLIIPGIVKSYEYYMVPYLLAEYPDMSRQEAFARSRDMMYGEKWNALILDLSFIPWLLLSRITVGVVGIFYVNPYVKATRAEFYDTLTRKMRG